MRKVRLRTFMPLPKLLTYLLLILVDVTLASCHAPKILYTPSPSATSANSATVSGSSRDRNAFNKIYGCLQYIEGAPVATQGPFVCKHLASERFLLAPGKYALNIGYLWESGSYSSHGSESVTIDVAAGKTYTVRAEELADARPGDLHSMQIWLEDQSGVVQGRKLDMSFVDPEKTADRMAAARNVKEEDRYYPMSQSNRHPIDPQTLPPIHRLFVYADFGDKSQPFERGFSERLQARMATCGGGGGVKIMTVPHASKLVLDPPKMPTDAEMLQLAATDGADYLLKIRVMEWAGPGAPSADLSRPFDDGRFNIETVLRPASGGELWHPNYFQPSVAKGGDAFAEDLVQALGKHGALPDCPQSMPLGAERRP